MSGIPAFEKIENMNIKISIASIGTCASIKKKTKEPSSVFFDCFSKSKKHFNRNFSIKICVTLPSIESSRKIQAPPK
jgi:hypothetical protein